MNHLYWIAAAAPEGDGDMLEAMWKSVTNHIQDIHDGHSDLYPSCEHGPLDEEDKDEEWLQPCKIYLFLLLFLLCFSLPVFRLFFFFLSLLC